MSGTTAHLVAFGVPWTLDLSHLAAEDRYEVHRRWERCRADVLDADPELTPQTTPVSPGSSAYDLSRHITRRSIDQQLGRLLLLHAAGLADPTSGATLGLIAPSGTGKTTSARILGHRFGYVTDETLAVRDDLAVVPYPKPLSVIEEGHPEFKRELSATDHGLLPTPRDPRLGGTVLLHRDPTLLRPGLEPAPLLDAVTQVIPQTSGLAWMSRPLVRLATALTAGAGVHTLHYAEIGQCGDLLERLLDPGSDGVTAERDWAAVSPPPGAMLPAPGSGPVSNPATSLPDGTRLVRAPWTDALAVDGEVLVLIGSTPLRLAGVGAIVWTCADQPVTVETATAHVVDALGPNPSDADLVAAAALELVRVGVLVPAEGPA
ncbi:hypothetical protein [Janibacter sp. G1551]|uniref:hypothetical protein n=1 Tax=Janibacter sp. G1551 TaxID=3420440 RepID=UPI003D014A48